MRIPDNFPIMARIDSVGAMFMAEDTSFGVRDRKMILGIILLASMLEMVSSRLCLLRQKTIIQSCSPRMSRRIPTRDMW
jgi:hypothetical protein